MRPPTHRVPGETLPMLLAFGLTCAGSVCAFAATTLHLQGIEAANTANAAAPNASTGSTRVAPARVNTAPVSVASTRPAPATPKSAAPISVAPIRVAPGVAPTSAAPTSVASKVAAVERAPPIAVASSAPATSVASQPASASARPCALGVVQFKLGVKVPGPVGRAALPAILTWLQADDGRRVLLRGHADAQGTDYYNMRLSATRARWIRRWLLDKGVDPTRVTAQAFGEFVPVADALPADARQRRVEIFGFGGPCPKRP